jgi:hypothetical protein
MPCHINTIDDSDEYVYSLNFITEPSYQHGLFHQSIPSPFALHNGIDLGIGGIGFDHLNLTLGLLFDIVFVLLLRLLIEFHDIYKLAGNSGDQIFSDSVYTGNEKLEG